MSTVKDLMIEIDMVRRSVHQMRSDAKELDDRDDDLIPTVADLLEVLASRAKSIGDGLPALSDGPRIVAEHLDGWTRALRVARAYGGKNVVSLHGV